MGGNFQYCELYSMCFKTNDNKKKSVSRPKRLDLKIRKETRICVLSHDDSSPTTLYAIDSDRHSESSFSVETECYGCHFCCNGFLLEQIYTHVFMC